MIHTSMILDPDACIPAAAAAPPIESMVLFCYILSMGGAAAAAAGANRGTMRLGYTIIIYTITISIYRINIDTRRSVSEREACFPLRQIPFASGHGKVSEGER